MLRRPLIRLLSKFRKRERRLHLSTSGKWYLLLTIFLGVAAISSGNNVLYLLESFLLGGLVLSGILSEWAISSMKISWRRMPSLAREPTLDWIQVKNTRKIPVFCIEIGEWVDGRFEPRLFIPYLSAGESGRFQAKSKFKKRGRYQWEAIGCATRYPFGFAKKERFIPQAGNRLIWPQIMSNSSLRREAAIDESPSAFTMDDTENQSSNKNSRNSGTISEGEIRQINPGEDMKNVVWKLSSKRQQLLSRERRPESPQTHLILDLRCDPSDQFEKQVSFVADAILGERHPHELVSSNEEDGTSLTLIDWHGNQDLRGSRRCLDALAMVEPVGGSQT